MKSYLKNTCSFFINLERVIVYIWVDNEQKIYPLFYIYIFHDVDSFIFLFYTYIFAKRICLFVHIGKTIILT